MKIGFIGQGWIGKNYADDFEDRDYEVVRYALEAPYTQNRDAITDCDIVFIAVPTPTTEAGFDDSALYSAIKAVGRGNIAVVKSTVTVGTTNKLQDENPDIFVFHSPEFLSERTAAYDAAHPNRNLIGIPKDTTEYRKKAQAVLDVLPDAPYQHIMHARDAELVKYAGNCFLYTKVLYMNILHDLVAAAGGDWERVRDALIHDPRIGMSHTEPVHTSGHAEAAEKVQRGAGGHCFIKDFETFRAMYRDLVKDMHGDTLLEAQAMYNLKLLISSKKDIDLVEGVYGDLNKFTLDK